ncbi:MAG: helix-turn-helix transcriptional regulator [Bacteroidia bacterium]|nr:helix-turn-helix transcriptional regulator [Bacteroidia bacterium]
MKDWYSLSDQEVLVEFGTRIRLARIEKNITQQMLADRAGLNRSTIRDLENGHSVNLLSLIQLLRILELLERFDLLLPGSSQSPVLAKLQNERKRVKFSKK